MTLTAHDRKYLAIAMPAALEGVFMNLLSMADLIMVGALGTLSIAAIGIFEQPRMVLLTVARSFASVLVLLTARRVGAGSRKEAGEVLVHSVFVTAPILAAMHLGAFFFLEDVLFVAGVKEEYLALAVSYATIAVAAVFFLSLATLLQAVLIGFGNTALVLAINVASNVLNVIGNAFLIFGIGPFPALGVEGAAIATLLGAFFAFAATLIALFVMGVFSEVQQIFPDLPFLREFGRLFAGIFGEMGCERVGMVLYSRMAAELGTIPFAVHSICMNFCDLYYGFAQGMGKASMVLAGQACGARRVQGWRAYLRAGVKWGLGFSLLAALLTAIFSSSIIGLYDSDPAVIGMGTPIMLFVAAVSFPEALALIFAGVLRGSGKTGQVAMCYFVSVTFLRPIFTAFLLYGLGLGILGAWIALLFDQCLRAVSSGFLVRRVRVAALMGKG